MNARMIVLACLLATVGVPARSAAVVLAPTTVDVYTLEFEPTQNALAGSSGVMTIKPLPGGTLVAFKLRGGYPNTVYTIWTVYNRLVVPLPTDGTKVPSADPPADFPPEGNGVAPLARLDKPFTDGMGLDQGMTFVTDDAGDGSASINLDYDLLGGPDGGPPVGNKNFAVQCVSPVDPLLSDPPCTPIKVATTWLRKFIGDYSPAERASVCANYEALAVRPGIDPRYWQCVDPANRLPRVHRYRFDHFRLAPHPDDLTHGLFGGNGTDHFIDMVGRRCQITPPIDDPCPQVFPLPVTPPLPTQPLATQPLATQPLATP